MKQKTNPKKLILISIIFLLTQTTQAQPDYVFTGGILESGTDLQIGAVYRFKDVKPGIDGIITILDMTGGMTLAQLDGPSGFDEAFQPYINCAPSQRGYVEFQLDFVFGGTTDPAVMAEVPLTAIDIDGWVFPDENLYELDQFEMSSAYYEQYDLLGVDVQMEHLGNWASVMNVNAVTYDGIDTIQKNVMFTAVHAGITSTRFRVGADNRSTNGMQRLRSIYFKKFYFNTGLLAAPTVKAFNSVTGQNLVRLNWELAGGSKLRNVTVEKSSDARNFSAISTTTVTYSEMGQKQYFEDLNASGTAIYYRLRLTDMEGRSSYSNVLVVKLKGSNATGFKVYPNIVQSSTTINMVSASRQEASISIVDLSGRILRKNQVSMQTGTNNMQINDLEKLSRGQYYVVIDLPGNRYTQPFIKK